MELPDPDEPEVEISFVDEYTDGYRAGFLKGYDDGVNDGRFQGYSDAKTRAFHLARFDTELERQLEEVLGER